MKNEGEQSTRQQLLVLLKRHRTLSVADLARFLGITEMAVRRHLNTLERDGFIDSSLQRQAMGRPMYVYSLSESADDLFPKNYYGLTLDLLEELEREEGTSLVTKLFELRQRKMERAYSERMQGKSLEERVVELTDIQNGGGYMAEWERDEETGSFIVREYNCPISQVAGRFEQACTCELSLFETLLMASVERTECLAKGGGKCVYIVQPSGQREISSDI
ncbi:helix-turn-helix transcriptional regulator [Paenibacillus turpanensis]|uniref:helix-turn-helix transcriptional regulator n=1 Tax=Paenibacillus turpanensis TaxID=2689078 RepID=UPI00140E7DCA|nr:metalloregulator ArsR/SmtB family transcription factor [Paenibacillus turpanensis]